MKGRPARAIWAAAIFDSMLELESMSSESAIGCGSRVKSAMSCGTPSSLTCNAR